MSDERDTLLPNDPVTESADRSISSEVRIRLEEYRALREEILSQMESQRQFISLAVIAVGTIFVASVQNYDPTGDHTAGAIMMLGYPLVSFFLAAGWGHNNRRTRQIGHYIRDHIEDPLGRDAAGNRIMSWEHNPLGLLNDFVAPFGVFVGSQVFAISFAAFLARFDLLSNIHRRRLCAGTTRDPGHAGGEHGTHTPHFVHDQTLSTLDASSDLVDVLLRCISATPLTLQKYTMYI